MTEPPLKKLRSMRRGTTRCLECRRRKTKCTYTQNDVEESRTLTCDGCRTRDTICESQDQARIREPTRERVDRLEVVVQNLSNTVADLQRSSREPETQVTSRGLLDDEVVEEDDGESDCAGTEDDATVGRVQSDKDCRERLIAMVPSRDDVLTVTASAVDWWHVHNAVFSEPAIKNRVELVKIHQELFSPGFRAISIAVWLLYFAITFLQLPNAFDHSTLQSIVNPATLVARISNEAETLLSQDTEMSTLEGLSQKLIGRPKKGWIMLRRGITFAELLNLHSAKRSLKMARKFSGDASTDSIQSLQDKANLWGSLCAIDRLLSLLLGLPTAASNFNNAQTDWDPTDPHASTKRIVAVQSNIANQIFRRDQLENHVEAFEETQDISRKLQALQKTWPADWTNIDRWTQYDARTASCVLFQTGHSFLVLRTLLPFLLKAKDHPEYQPQAMECLQACRDILKRYYIVRTRLNVGGFMSRSFDVHAFTASVILLLHHDGVLLHMCTTDQALLENAKEAMRQAPDRTGMQLTQRMVVSLNSIQQCLDGDSGSPESVVLKVPLLGDVTIRRMRWQGQHVNEGEPSIDTMLPSNQTRRTIAKVSFNFDALDDEWFLQDTESGV